MHGFLTVSFGCGGAFNPLKHGFDIATGAGLLTICASGRDKCGQMRQGSSYQCPGIEQP